MKFSEYMAAWLYADDGYYASYRPIGKSGDFYTSVSASKFFGGTVANHLLAVIDEGFLSEHALVCEIGAHHGYLLADIIEFVHTLRPALIGTLCFAIIERFEHLREQQRHYFEAAFGDAVQLRHYASLAELECEEAFFVANELFDAFPCELFYKGKTGRVEGHDVMFDTEDAWVSKKAEQFHKDRGEIAVGYEAFAQQMAQAARKSEFLTFDYGEMQARADMSLRVYKTHGVFPFFDETLVRADAYKQCDLTYDVTFAHLQEAFESAGMSMVQYATQMKALIEMGIMDLLEMLRTHAEEKVYKQELEKVKTLIMPQFLGERFKMIRFRKEY